MLGYMPVLVLLPGCVVQFTNDQAESMASQICKIRMVYLHSVKLRVASDTPTAEPPRLLRAGLTLANAFQVTGHSVSIVGFTATPEVIQELQHLPACPGWLRLGLISDPTTTAAPWPLAALPDMIPRYESVHAFLTVFFDMHFCTCTCISDVCNTQWLPFRLACNHTKTRVEEHNFHNTLNLP